MAANDVSNYYDRSSRAFLLFGHGRRQLAIHRAVHGPGVTNRSDAIHFVHDLILGQIVTTGASRVVDLGCGVGGSIQYLAHTYAAEYVGITISGAQARLAKRVLEDAPGTTVVCGDMADISRHLPGIQERTACYAIESFVHVSRQDELFEGIGNALIPGDLLIVCDDTLSGDSVESPAVARFKAGWRAEGLSPVGLIKSRARSAGLSCTLDLDLTPYLELDRPRDIVIRAFVRLLRLVAEFSPWISSLVGGDALQICLKRREICYRFLVFRKG